MSASVSLPEGTFQPSSWWFQPIWKTCSSNWIISPILEVKKKETSTQANSDLQISFVFFRCRGTVGTLEERSRLQFASLEPSLNILHFELGFMTCFLLKHQLKTYQPAKYQRLLFWVDLIIFWKPPSKLSICRRNLLPICKGSHSSQNLLPSKGVLAFTH